MPWPGHGSTAISGVNAGSGTAEEARCSPAGWCVPYRSRVLAQKRSLLLSAFLFRSNSVLCVSPQGNVASPRLACDGFRQYPVRGSPLPASCTPAQKHARPLTLLWPPAPASAGPRGQRRTPSRWLRSRGGVCEEAVRTRWLLYVPFDRSVAGNLIS